MQKYALEIKSVALLKNSQYYHPGHQHGLGCGSSSGRGSWEWKEVNKSKAVRDFEFVL